MLMWMLVLPACAPRTFDGTATTSISAPVEHAAAGLLPIELIHVPFYPQAAWQCGPAALATVLDAAGRRLRPDDLINEVYLPASHGSLQAELVATARRQGLVAYVLALPTRADLHAELVAGNPVLVLQSLGFGRYPRWHYAVLVGLTGGGKEVILRSGSDRRRVVPWRAFARTWDRAQRWAVVVTPPERLPASVREIAYLRAAAAFERLAQWQVARRAYEAALARWPRSLGAHIGLANALYATGEIDGAATILRAATQAHPTAAVAYNNLAFVLARQGDLVGAEAAVTRAIELGEGQAVYRQTLSEIRARRCVSGLCSGAVRRR